MQYVKVTFAITGQDAGDILMALLADAGYDGFEETGQELFAYIEQPKFDDHELKSIAEVSSINYKTELIPSQNWNALWESNFEPVIVADLCTIRADFHDIEITTPYEIIITPKMSFGTGHHATTQLMITLMNDVSFTGRSVLDFGTGTGVLAILAEMMGAAYVLAIDNDEWSAENARENILRNHCKNITVQQGSLDDVDKSTTDIILANINRNILLQYMPALYRKLSTGGTILMSGLLAEDEQAIIQAATNEGFIFHKIAGQSNWIAIIFKKI
jgi:ribosomal protein L11 methyltransferase